MIWHLIIEISTFLAVAASAGAAICALRKTSREVIEKNSLSLYEKYTARYSHIMEIMPKEYYLSHPSKVQPQIQDEINSKIRLYIDLSSEELFLYKEHYVNDEVWEEWEGGIKGTFKNPFVIEFWSQNKDKYQEDYQNFYTFIAKMQTSSEE